MARIHKLNNQHPNIKLSTSLPFLELALESRHDSITGIWVVPLKNSVWLKKQASCSLPEPTGWEPKGDTV